MAKNFFGAGAETPVALGADLNETPAVFAQLEALGLERGRPTSRRAAACGRAELLAKGQHTDRLQNPAKLRRFRIGGG